MNKFHCKINSSQKRMKSIPPIFFAILVLSPFAGIAADDFKATDPMHTSRAAHTATLLPNGNVLVAGGSVVQYFDYTSRAELYDTATGLWKNTGWLNIGRMTHTATLLQNGKVLVAGGYGSTGSLDSAELYNPATQTWSPAKSLHESRYLHTATLLQDGRVLVVGGFNETNLTSAELYNSVTRSWTRTGSLNTARYGHSATLLSNGKVLVAGGAVTYIGYAPIPLSSAELYDPRANRWFETGSMTTARWQHTATLLPNGEVLVVGGRNLSDTNSIGRTAELYNPFTGQWRPTNPMEFARYLHAATLVKGGQVLVVGGADDSDDSLSSAEIYDSLTAQWRTVSSMNDSHEWPSATLLLNGSVLIAGGIDTNGITSDAGLYDFPGSHQTWNNYRRYDPSAYTNQFLFPRYPIPLSQ
jgi:N-acetylneuraminic acid mutarotase